MQEKAKSVMNSREKRGHHGKIHSAPIAITFFFFRACSERRRPPHKGNQCSIRLITISHHKVLRDNRLNRIRPKYYRVCLQIHRVNIH